MSRLREINNLAAEIISGSYFQGGHRIANKNAKKIFSLSEPIELNDNQQIVLDWLKAYADSDSGNGDKPISAIWYMMYLITGNAIERIVRNAYFELTRKQEAEVLQAFAEWGLNHERN